MEPDPIKDDERSKWPEDIRQAYEHLKIPTLYDALLMNEKLSLEIRRQNKEIKELSTNFQLLSSQMEELMEDFMEEFHEVEDREDSEREYAGVEGLQEEFPPYQELTDLEQQLLTDNQEMMHKQVRSILIEMVDTVIEVSQTTHQVLHHLMAIIPQKDSFLFKETNWRPIAEELIKFLKEHTGTAQAHVLSRLEETKISIINPALGEAFVPQKHRMAEQATGGKTGTIARTIRIGYSENETVLRLADVAVYV